MLQIRKILCPVDFSDFSRNAFDRAVAIARLHHASVTVLHVLPVPSVPPLIPYTGARRVQPETSEVDRQHVAAQLEAFLALDASTGVQVRCEVGEAPDAAWEIVARALRLSADLIVMGTHGRSGFERLLFGSVAEKVLRTASQPVLTVPSGAPQVVPIGAAPFRRILCATDFSDCSLAALRYAASFALHPGVTLTVLHVVEITPSAYSPVMGPPLDVAGFRALLEESSREDLHRAIPDAVRDVCRVEEIVTSGKPHREILRMAREQATDLIALGIMGRGAIDRLMFGSTAEAVVRSASCPVLSVRPLLANAEAATERDGTASSEPPVLLDRVEWSV